MLKFKRLIILIAVLAITLVILTKIFSLQTATIVLVIITFILLISHTYWLIKLDLWLNSKKLDTLPHGNSIGLWNKVFTKIYRSQLKQKRTNHNLFEALDQFKSAAEAMYDGIISVNENNEIIWSNKTAQRMINIIPRNDYNQPVNYIFRNSDFKQYIENEDFSKTLKITNQANMLPLEVRVANFSNNHRIIILRDMAYENNIQNMRKEFVSNFSHELKTPLTVILGFLETLQMSTSNKENEKKIIDLMNNQAYRMKSLIDDLLLLSNVESNNEINRSEKINISLLVKEIKKNIAEVNGVNHKFIFSIDSKLNIYGAKHEVLSAFSNLITNAIRYTPKKGRIDIRWNQVGEHAVFEVVDSGIGIAETDLAKVSNRFYRVDPDRSRNTGGTGLGLAIVKNVMMQHQGEMKISSKVNQGSAFKLFFPINRIID